MVNSISSSSMTGIKSLNNSVNNLNGTQGRISTGLRVSDPKQNSAVFAIAQQISGDVAGLTAMKSSFNQAEAAVGTALSAGQAVNDLLVEMKGKVVQANQQGLDDASRKALDNEFQQMASQLNSLTSSANFGGSNLVQNGGENVDVLMNPEGDVLQVKAQDLSTAGLGLDGVSLTTQDGAANALNSIDSAISSATSGVSELGSAAQQIENQSEFTTSLDNVLSEGLGKMVDADLGSESATLAAERVKTELGMRSLAIANAGPQAMRSLFPG